MILTVGLYKVVWFNRAIRDKQIGQFKNMAPGLAINYLERYFSKHLDISALVWPVHFLDYPIAGKSAFGNDNLLLEGTC